MKKQTMFFSFLFAACFMHAGILFDTLVQTPDGLKRIQELVVGDIVISAGKDFLLCPKPITSIEEKELDCYVEITMENNEILRVSVDQRFFIPCKWVQADQLSLGDVLVKNDGKFTRIKSISVKQERVMIRFIIVQDYENFFASRNNVLIHNGPVFGAIGYWATKTLCYGTAAAAASTIVVTGTGPVSVVIASTVGAAGGTATVGASAVAAGMVQAGLATEAAVATAAAASSVGGVAGAVAAVESASTLVGGILAACPFLP